VKRKEEMKTPILDANRYVIDLEQEYGLFDRKIDGIYFWKLVRFSLSRRIEILRGTLEPSKDLRVEKPVLKQFMRFVRSFDHCYSNPRIILYEHSRKVKHQNTYIDPYSWRVTRALEDAKADFCLLENDLYYQCDIWDTRRWFLFPSHLSRVPFKKLENIPDETLRLIHTLERKILFDLGQQIDLEELVRSSVNKFKRDYAYFSAALRNKSVAVMFVVCGYGKEGVIQAAKDAGVYVVELQHGTIYPLHLGYSYPGWRFIPYFSDSMAVYADVWLDDVSLQGVDVKVIGYAPANPVETDDKRKNKTIDVLFISQWIHSEKILRSADKAAQLMPDKKIVCKLHPSDSVDAEAAQRYPNIKITKDGLLCDYLSAAKYAVTVFSTGIFESLQYNCRPILLNMNGIQYMDNFVKVTGAPVFSEATELAAFIKETDDKNDSYRNLGYKYWFGDFNESAIFDYVKRGVANKSV
jgi:hypothetical protein